MQKLVLLFAILTAATPVAKVEPWRRIELSGWIRCDEPLALFGTDEKHLSLEVPVIDANYTTSERLAFGSTADYKFAEKNIDQAVRVDGYLIRRGCDQWLVPVSVSVKAK